MGAGRGGAMRERSRTQSASPPRDAPDGSPRAPRGRGDSRYERERERERSGRGGYADDYRGGGGRDEYGRSRRKYSR